MNHKNKKGTIIAGGVLVALFASTGVYAYATPAYLVSLDVNPGINLEVNAFEQVIGVEAVNEDAEAVLKDLNLENMSVDDALAETVEKIADMGYLVGEDRDILISTSSDDEFGAVKLTEWLEETLVEEVKELEIDAEVTAKVTGKEMVQKAKELGITPGKYNIIVNHLGKNPEEYAEVTVKDIMKEVKEARKAEKSDAEKPKVEDVKDADLDADLDAVETPQEDAVNQPISEEKNLDKKEEEKKSKDKETSVEPKDNPSPDEETAVEEPEKEKSDNGQKAEPNEKANDKPDNKKKP